MRANVTVGAQYQFLLVFINKLVDDEFVLVLVFGVFAIMRIHQPITCKFAPQCDALRVPAVRLDEGDIAKFTVF